MNFEALKVLVFTLSKNRIKHLDLYVSNPDTPTKINELYEGIASGRLTSDESAMEALFEGQKAADASYRQLKKRLVRQLTNTVFFIDTQKPQYSERAKSFYNAYKDFAAAYILTVQGALLPAIKILEKTLEQAMRYEYVDLCAEITKALRYAYNRSSPGSRKHQYYVHLHRDFETKRSGEVLAADYYETLAEHYQVKKFPRAKIVSMAKAYFTELQGKVKVVNTAMHTYYTYQCAIIGKFAENDIHAVLQFSETCLDLIESNPNTNTGSIFSMAMQKMHCLVQLRNLNKTESDAFFSKHINSIQEGSYNWFRMMEVNCYYNAYMKDYPKCVEIYGQVNAQPNFSSLPLQIQELWQLIGQYLILLSNLGALDRELVESVVGNVRMYKALNEIELLDRDISGMNIPVLLLPFLDEIATDRDAAQFRSWDALEKYRIRYLVNRVNERSNSFVKLLHALGYFYESPKTSAKIVKRELKKLQDNEPKIAGQAVWIEVIPYEDLGVLLERRANELLLHTKSR
jgi:hypothetical protein